MQIRSHRRWTRVAGALAVVVIAAACAKKGPAEDTKSAGGAAPVDPEAPPVVVAMIDAHGGMAPWRSSKTVSFEDEFSSAAGGPSVVSRVMVDQASRHAYIDIPATDEHMAWDGKRAWSLHWKQNTPPRFLGLLNYYFLDIPWLTMDPGVMLKSAGTDTLWSDPTQYSVVKMTFRPGTGDTPRDTYRLYIDPATKRLKACAYQVTYRALLPDSVDAMPEHILVYEDFTKANGLLVPTRYTIYAVDHTPLYACSIRDWSFERPFDEKKLAMPDSGVVDESQP